MNGTPNRFDGVKPIDRKPLSGLSVLVVGGGIAGLGFAIEAYRKGHETRIIDRRPNFDDYGRLTAIIHSNLYHWKLNLQFR